MRRSTFIALALGAFGGLGLQWAYAQAIDVNQGRFRNITVTNSMSVGNDLTVGDDLTVTDTLKVAVLDAGVARVNGDLTAIGTAKLEIVDAGYAHIAGDFSVGGNASFGGNTNLGGINVLGASANVIRNSTTSNINMTAAGNIEINPVSTFGTRFVNSYIQVDTNINLAGPVLTDTSTDPTVTACSGGTAATITAANGSAAFQIDVGTSCAGESTAVFTLPAAATGWVCNCSSTTADRMIQQKAASSTTVVTMQNIVISTGANGDFTDGADLFCMCRAY